MTEVENAIPVPLPPLRGLGPRVFISYSFRDRELAEPIANYLERAGMQVRIEDETSLLGSSLGAVLPTRIGRAEVFLQILTEISAKSSWVEREFKWATVDGPAGSRPLVVLPIVIGDVSVPDSIADWVYLQLTTTDNSEALDLIRRKAMESVAVIPLDLSQPYQFSDSELVEFCTDETLNDRRVIVDSDGVVPKMVRATIVYGDGSVAEHKRQLIEQQRRVYDATLRRLTALDAYLPEFVRYLLPLVRAHWRSEEWPRRSAEVIQSFARLVLGPAILDLVDGWSAALTDGDLAQAVRHGKDASTRSQALQASAPGLSGAGRTFWALGGSIGQRWLDLGMDGRAGIAGVHIFLPEDHFDDDGALLLTRGLGRPAAEVTMTDWLAIALPQVAASGLPAAASEVTQRVRHTGWSIADYTRSGRY